MKRRHLSGSRIMTNGTISPRLSASPQPPHHHSPASSTSGSSSGYLMGIAAAAASHSSPRLTPTLPAIRETISPSSNNGGKMPLNGKVPGYRQPAGEIWIDGELAVDRPTRRISPLGHNSPSSPLYPMATSSNNGGVLTNSSLINHLNNNNSSNNAPQMATPTSASAAKPEIRRYGFMDDFKASMITHWVENQKDRHTTPPEGCSTSSPSAMFLTQFKQADSSDSGSEQLAIDALNNSIKAEVHQPPQNNNPAQVKDRQKPPPAPPRRSSSREKDMSCITASVAPNMDFMIQKSAKSGNQLIEDPITSHLQSRLLSPDSDDLEIDLPREDGERGAEGGAKLSPRGETEGSEASSVAPLPEPNFEQLFPSSLSGEIDR